MALGPGTIIAGKYELVRELAHGGMGSVWIARHRDLEVDVAVKLIADRLADRSLARQRFKREARAAAQLKSPHVTQIHDYGVHEDTPYIAMELLEGRDLGELIAELGQVPLERAVEIVRPLCRALKLAHDAGIVHRDLKPSNVFLARSGEDEVVKILDFGVAKEVSPKLVVGDGTASGSLVGSPRYMSPEQAVGEPVDHRSDLWSVGVLVYEMLTGARPFQQEHLGQLIAAICSAPIEAPSARAATLPPAIDAFFDKALARRPADRFQSAAALYEAFAAAAGRPDSRSLTGSRSSAAPRVADGSATSADTAHAETVPATLSSEGAVALRGPDDGTAAGVGVDSVRAEPLRGRRRGWIAAGGLAALGVAGWLAARSTANDAAAPAPSASAPAAGASAPAAPDLPVASPDPAPARAPTASSAPVASSAGPVPTVTPRPRWTAPAVRPPSPPPAPVPAPAPSYHPEFGIPRGSH